MQTHKSFLVCFLFFILSFCFLRDSPTFLLSLPIHNHMHTWNGKKKRWRNREQWKSVTMNDDETFVVVFSRLARSTDSKTFWWRRQWAATGGGCSTVVSLVLSQGNNGCIFIWPPIIHVGTTNRVPFLVHFRFLLHDVRVLLSHFRGTSSFATKQNTKLVVCGSMIRQSPYI